MISILLLLTVFVATKLLLRQKWYLWQLPPVIRSFPPPFNNRWGWWFSLCKNVFDCCYRDCMRVIPVQFFVLRAGSAVTSSNWLVHVYNNNHSYQALFSNQTHCAVQTSYDKNHINNTFSQQTEPENIVVCHYHIPNNNLVWYLYYQEVKTFQNGGNISKSRDLVLAAEFYG